MAQGLVCTVSLVWVHSHSLTSARALSYRPAQSDVKSMFDSYFEEGMTPAEAMRFHRSCMEMAPNFREEDLADASKNPLPRSVYYWHTTWRKVHLGQYPLFTVYTSYNCPFYGTFPICSVCVFRL